MPTPKAPERGSRQDKATSSSDAGASAIEGPVKSPNTGRPAALTPEMVIKRYHAAMSRRQAWEGLWQDCYDFALPLRDGHLGNSAPGQQRTEKLFDGTAPDAVDQLAASLLANLTPPWAEWFGLKTGPHVEDGDREIIDEGLSEASELLRANFDRSNFSVEIHQAFLDLVTVGTACLLFESASVGDASAFRFTAVPIGETAFEEDAYGRLTGTFRRSLLTVPQFRERFPKAELPERFKNQEDGFGQFGGNDQIPVIEAVLPDGPRFTYMAVLDQNLGSGTSHQILNKGLFEQSPFIVFRWMKAPGEIYGRSPVMKCLPDIKTANKVIELVLKNASIAVTGIWQADDDGVLNPANIRLTPGTIIPKAVGSAGLVPLETPGRFDTGNIVMDELRARIKHALLADRLGQVDGPTMTATEVMERSAEMGRILGATFGRLQSELLTPLVLRAHAILIKRGILEPIEVDGQVVELEYKSPLAKQQAADDIKATLDWIQHLNQLGAGTMNLIDGKKAALWFARMLGVPRDIIRNPDTDPSLMDMVGGLTPGLSDQPPNLDALKEGMDAVGKQLGAAGVDVQSIMQSLASTGAPNPPAQGSPANAANPPIGPGPIGPTTIGPTTIGPGPVPPMSTPPQMPKG